MYLILILMEASILSECAVCSIQIPTRSVSEGGRVREFCQFSLKRRFIRVTGKLVVGSFHLFQANVKSVVEV